ncbi:cytochrome P450 [Nocardia sp. NPDC051570]|uniref:cytochrome P450 n=1 Tax=Nocardia sp. NPDC051570 TaxID=3364324 RepID=UPI003798AECA
MTSTDDSTATAIASFPFPRRCPMSPPDAYAELREQEPVSRATIAATGRPTWLVTRYEDVRKILGDPDVSANLKLPGYPLQVPVPDEVLQSVRPMLLSMDPPEHTAQRRMLIPEFTAHKVRTMRPHVQQIVDARIDAMLDSGGPVDLVTALALPVPSLVICELLGVPYADHGSFESWSGKIMTRGMSQEDYVAAVTDLDNYLDGLVTSKETAPGDDLLSRFIEKNRENPVADHVDIVTMARLMLIGGHETTSNMISLGVLAFLRDPELLDAVRADPALMPAAVEEFLRYFAISDAGTPRVALADIEVGGVTIAAGDGILPLNNSANHDPAAFTDPDRIDFHRTERGHLTFGFGIHQCIGANLARLELDVVYRTLFDRIPNLRLAVPFEELSFKHDAMVYGMHGLPATW